MRCTATEELVDRFCEPIRSQSQDSIVETSDHDYSLPLSKTLHVYKWSRKMVYRPRTKAKLAKKSKRCPKCGKIIRGLTRCKRCHAVQS